MTVNFPMSKRGWRLINLKGGVTIKVDVSDFKRVSLMKWRIVEHGSYPKAVTAKRVKGKSRNIYLARFILQAPVAKIVSFKNKPERGMIHDYRKANLFISSRQQRQWSLRKREGTTSQYKGVSFLSRSKMWRAAIHVDGKSFNLGDYASEWEAAEAYNRAANARFGEFAVLNEVRKESSIGSVVSFSDVRCFCTH